MPQLTRRTHFNPAAWIAHWNVEFYEHPEGKKARTQRVYVLDLFADKVYPDKVDDVHFERDLGNATVTFEEARTLLSPTAANALAEYAAKHDAQPSDQLIVWAEDFFTQAEKGPGYRELHRLIKQQSRICR